MKMGRVLLAICALAVCAAAEPEGKRKLQQVKLNALERTEPVEPSKAVEAASPAKPFFYPFLLPFWDKESVAKTMESVKQMWADIVILCRAKF